MALSDRLDLVNPSEIRKLFDLAAGMQDVISLGIGEPDFDTPLSISKDTQKRPSTKGIPTTVRTRAFQC